MHSRDRAPSPEVATVGACFVAYGGIFFDRLAPLYLVAMIAADLGVPSAAEGTLALFVGVGWAVAMPVARRLSGRWSDRDQILIAMVVTAALSLGSAASAGWLMFVLLRGAGGIVSGTAAPAVTALSFGAAPARRRGLDLGIVQASTRLVGSLVSPVAVTAVAVVAGWRAAMVASAAVLLVGALLLVLLIPSHRSPSPRTSTSAFRLHSGGRRNIAISALCGALLLGWLTVWSQSALPLLSDWLNLGADSAGRLAGVFGAGAGIAALAVPMTSDRLGRRAALALGSGLGGSAGLLLGVLAASGIVPSRPALVSLIFAAGFAMGGLPLVLSIIPAEAVAEGAVGRALVTPIAGAELLGGAATPVLAAVAAVPFGHSCVIAATATGVLAIVALSLMLKEVGPRY